MLNLCFKRCSRCSDLRRLYSTSVGFKKTNESRTTMKENQNSKAMTEKWHIASAVCLERFPIVGAPLNDIQQKYSDLLDQIEIEKSLLSDHELKERQEKKKKDKEIKRKDEGKDEELKSEIVITAKEFEAASLAELRLFQFGPVTTAADKNDDKKSLQRLLSRKLTLVVQQKNVHKVKWQFPQAIRTPTETLRETAERALKEFVNPNEMYNFYGNAPVAFCKMEYSNKWRQQLDSSGIKVFFFKAQITKNDLPVQKSKDIVDYLWLTQDEVIKTVSKNYASSISHLLFE